MTSPETGLREYFTGEHRSCDSQWAAVEETADGPQGEALGDAWRRFAGALRRHLAQEEEVLFPAFEEATGMRGGPTAVMRSEHAQMRALLQQMDAALARGETRELLDQGDTLLMLIQQHNQKEEGVLYPMVEQVLGPRWAELRPRVEALKGE